MLYEVITPVDLVDEEHVASLEVREQRREIARPLDRRPARDAQRRAHLARDHVRERGLAETGRTVEEQMVERLPALASGPDEHVEVLAQAILPHHLGEAARAQHLLEPLLAGGGETSYNFV